MFWEEIDPILTDRLTASVETAYEVFSPCQLHGTITYCNCPVCMTDETAIELSTRPLKEISATLLAEYTNSAHGYDRKTIEPQFKYFLPRYLDLIAHCDPPSHLDLDTCLTRLEGYQENWLTKEVETINEFFNAFIESSLYHLYLIEWPVGPRLEFDMGEVLTMVVLAGGDLDRCLQTFDKGPDPETAVHMAALRADVQIKNGNPTYHNVHLEAHPQAAQKIGTWLHRKSVSERILKAPELLNDPNYDDVIELGMIEI